jgi:hypothetical protein
MDCAGSLVAGKDDKRKENVEREEKGESSTWQESEGEWERKQRLDRVDRLKKCKCTKINLKRLTSQLVNSTNIRLFRNEAFSIGSSIEVLKDQRMKD